MTRAIDRVAAAVPLRSALLSILLVSPLAGQAITLARALESAGMTAEAHATWRSLAGVWHGADAGLPGLDEARSKAKP